MKELFIKEVTTKMADFLDDNQRIRLREINWTFFIIRKTSNTNAFEQNR